MVWAWLSLAALAAEPEALPRVVVEAEISEDLRTITGDLWIGDAPDGLTLVDPLADLPVPPDDRTLLRTWRGRPRPGAVTWQPVEPGHWTFTTTLPRHRFGDLGTWDRQLLANGAWYPQPLVHGTLPIARWDVTVTGPADAVVVVGDALAEPADGTAEGTTDGVGDGPTAWWGGTAERASLAVVRRAQVVTDGDVSIVSRRPKRILRRQPAALLDRTGLGQRVVVVEAPLRRRLARPGPGLLYLSNRAWRLTPGLRTYHDRAVTRGLVEASIPAPAPFERALAASLATRLAPAADARGLLRWFSWNPVVDAILNDRRLPFWADVFGAPHPEDPLRDDLVERFAPHGPTEALAAQLAATTDEEALRAAAGLLSWGSTAELVVDAAAGEGRVQGWQHAYPDQDLTLSLADDGVRVSRVAPVDAPSEVLEVRIDGEIHREVLPPGPGEVHMATAGRPGRVVVDPRGLMRQTSRVGDSYPPRLVILGAAWIDTVNLTERFVSGHAIAWARGRDDNRNIAVASVTVDQQDLPGISLGWMHRRGPQQDGLSRPHRFGLYADAAWSNPAFADGDASVFTVSGTASYVWDTRISALFPLRGRMLGAWVTGGLAPTEDTRWGQAQVAGAGVVSPHPRWAIAGRLGAGIAAGDTRQRLLWLGGPSSAVSLTPGIEIGVARTAGRGELRWAPIRGASVPLLGAAWLSEIQLTAGAEAAWLRTVEGHDASVVGLTAGLAVVVDLLGANPALGGVTVGLPAHVSGVDDADGVAVDPWSRPQLTIRFGQAF